MSIHAARSFVCPVIIGRAGELATLHGHLTGEGPAALLLSGEAGIGKSRLVAEARRQATDRSYHILQGYCYEADAALPYGPILEILRPLLTTGTDGDAERAGAAREELASLLPGLAPRRPEEVIVPAVDGQEHKRRVAFAMTDLVTALAEKSPLLLVVEDLHWSDEASLGLLAYLVRHVTYHSIRFLFSYRTDESHPTLSHVVAELERERLGREVTLSRLTPDQSSAMMRAILDPTRAIPADMASTLHRLTDGNPFFVEEALKSLAELGDLTFVDGIWERKPAVSLRVPRTVRDAVRRRTSHLTESTRRVLALAAVIGHRFDVVLLQLLTGLDAIDLLAAIKELVGQQLVVEASADLFAFRHALTREAIYSDLLARERRELHREIAEAMESARTHPQADRAQPAAADLAYHFDAAGVWEKALLYSREAGNQSLAVYAPRSAIEHFNRALEASRHLGVEESPQLYHQRGTAYEILGEFENACGDYEAELTSAQTAGDREGEWQALLDLAQLWSGRDYARVGDFIHRSLDLARESGDPATLAHSLNRLGNWYTNVERPREGLAYHREALDIFERLEDRQGMAETLDFLGMASVIAADPPQSAAYYERAIPLLEEIDDRRRLVISLTIWILTGGLYFSETTVPAVLDMTDATARGKRALEITRAIDWPAGEAFVLYELALWHGPHGRYREALECARSALQLADEIGHQQWVVGALCALGALHLDLLDTASAQQYLERALALAQEFDSLLWIRNAAGFLVSAYVQLGKLDKAAKVLALALEDEAPMETIGQRLCWRGHVQLALARGDGASALEVVDRLIATLTPDPPDSVVPVLWRLRGEALALLGKHEEAVETLRAAADAGAHQGVIPQLWRIQIDLGKTLHTLGRRLEARAAFDAARAVIQELAGGIADEALTANFIRRTAALLPPVRAPSPGRKGKERFGGLTARERDVAVRVAEGKSNRVIAQEIVVTERTVEGYVGNIFNKLGFNSRAQIAAWVVEKGLVG